MYRVKKNLSTFYIFNILLNLTSSTSLCTEYFCGSVERSVQHFKLIKHISEIGELYITVFNSKTVLKVNAQKDLG